MKRRSPELRAAARAAALARAGDFAEARGALAAIAPERAEQVLAPALGAAIDFAEAVARAASRSLHPHPQRPGEAIAPLKEAARAVAAALGGVCPVSVGHALMAEAELVAPWMTLPIGACAGLLHEQTRPFLARHLMEAMLREAGSPEEAALVVTHVAGAEAFAAAERGAAYVYEGFAWLRAGALVEAAEAFAKARAAGGDEAEVQRGELLCRMAEEARIEAAAWGGAAEFDLLAELEVALCAFKGAPPVSGQRARRPDPPLAPEPDRTTGAWLLQLTPAIPPPAPPPRPAWARTGATARAILRLAVALRVTPEDPPSAAASGSAPSAPARGRGSRRGDRRSSGSRPGRS